mmetsp:Transcript_37969/g.38653  ORF Transcript_37969/g.38653 Transcript_37969/m.38653 type:complete len:346 (+) Transcript_37969:73-1110(+)
MSVEKPSHQHMTIAPTMMKPIRQTTIQMQAFWRKFAIDISEVNPDQEDFKFQILPLSRIKKVMKLEDEIRDEKCMISGEAPVVFAKACEIFIAELALRAWIVAEDSKRRTLLRGDLSKAVSSCELYDFLLDIIPRDGSTAPMDELGFPSLTMGVTSSSTSSFFSGQQLFPLPMQIKIQKPSTGEKDNTCDSSMQPTSSYPILFAKGLGLSLSGTPENPGTYTMQLVNTGDYNGKATAQRVPAIMPPGLLPYSAPEVRPDILSSGVKRPMPEGMRLETDQVTSKMRTALPEPVIESREVLAAPADVPVDMEAHMGPSRMIHTVEMTQIDDSNMNVNKDTIVETVAL